MAGLLEGMTVGVVLIDNSPDHKKQSTIIYEGGGMKTKLSYTLILIVIGFVFIGYAWADFNKGIEAFQKGDKQTAVKHFQTSAQQGHIQSQHILGLMYEEGVGVSQNHEKAAFWHRKAAEQDHSRSQLKLGLKYLEGEGVPRDIRMAIKWFHRAANNGDTDAQFNLGLFNSDGTGMPQNYSEAAKWYRKAAELGHSMAQNNLGNHYFKGQGVSKNFSKAFKWWQRSANQGVDLAQISLGVMYAKGEGVQFDPIKAHMWFNVAAAQGNKNGENNRNLIAGRMTPSQISKAQNMASEWRPKKETPKPAPKPAKVASKPKPKPSPKPAKVAAVSKKPKTKKTKPKKKSVVKPKPQDTNQAVTKVFKLSGQEVLSSLSGQKIFDKKECKGNPLKCNGTLATGVVVWYMDKGKTNIFTITTYKKGKKEGKYYMWRPDNNVVGKVLGIEIIGEYKNNKKDGIEKEYYPSGMLKMISTFKGKGSITGRLDGPYEIYSEKTGTLVGDGTYKKGKLHGLYREYYLNGSLYKECTYENGKITGSCSRYEEGEKWPKSTEGAGISKPSAKSSKTAATQKSDKAPSGSKKLRGKELVKVARDTISGTWVDVAGRKTEVNLNKKFIRTRYGASLLTFKIIDMSVKQKNAVVSTKLESIDLSLPSGYPDALAQADREAAADLKRSVSGRIFKFIFTPASAQTINMQAQNLITGKQEPPEWLKRSGS